MVAILSIPPVCKVDGCKEGASILSKQGDTVRYMLTCTRHWYGQIPKEPNKKEK